MRHQPFVLLLIPALLSACSQPARQEITDVREPGSVQRAAPPKADARQRLQMGMGTGNTADVAADDPLGGITFHHDMPAGWEAAEPTAMRQVNLRFKDSADVECYFTFLPGGGGGLHANINRWRKQMGLDDLSADAVAALPQKPIFGQSATFILIDGDYAGMGTEAKADYRLYGLILTYTDPQSQEEQAFFLKMTGPREILETQEDAFDLIASSLHAVAPGDEHTHDHGSDDHADHAGHEDHADHGDHEGHADHEKMAAAPTENVAGGDGFVWTVPAGWETIEPTMMRQANLIVTGHDDVECYFTVLAGTGGGLEMNINRWQQQMGQPELSGEAIAALPKHTLLGGEATLVVIDGTFGGMGGSMQKENFRMYGLVRVESDRALFVKMTGPQAVLAAEEANFLAFSASIQSGSTTASAAATPAAQPMDNPHGIADPTPAGGFNPEGLTWTAPEGWQDGGERMMRVVTYEFGNSECYVTSLAGEAGGVNANINRWIDQMGQPALDETALAALPKIKVLGTEAPLVEVSGDFTGMSGEEKKAYKLFGTVVPVGDQTVFVKMIGPEPEVNAQKEQFIAFCASLKP